MHIWAPHCKENIDQVEEVQWKASKLVRGSSTHPGLVQAGEDMAPGEPKAASQCLKGGLLSTR